MREHALEIFNAAVTAVQPSCLLPQYIRLQDDLLWLHRQSFSLQEWDHIYVIGAGKASAAMALETEKIILPHITKGIVVTKYDHALPLSKIKCIEAGHPLPDVNSVGAGKAVMELAQQASEKDIIIALISGGASALLADHPLEASLGAMQHLFRLLLQCGATIDEMNTVRKHLSQIKGGQLSRAAYPATLVAFVLSDVIGDPLDVIASGPTVPDPTTFADAYGILQHYNLITAVPSALLNWLLKGLRDEVADTPKPGDPAFEKTANHLIGTNRIALEAATAKASALGYTPIILTDQLQGEASIQAAAFVEHLYREMYNNKKRYCVLMGGETTVSIRGNGTGGRNQEFALAALQELMKRSAAGTTGTPVILSAGTDGTDGPTEVTGAVIDAQTIAITNDLKIDPAIYLANNDSYHFFQKVGGHIITGATQTNVMDIVVALIV